MALLTSGEGLSISRKPKDNETELVYRFNFGFSRRFQLPGETLLNTEEQSTTASKASTTVMS